MERRIARRAPVNAIAVTFRCREHSRTLLGRVRSKVVSEPGDLVDLSVTGAGIVVRKISGLGVKASVELCHEGHVATAQVRRIVEREDGRMLYGVDFKTMDPGMREFLFAVVATERSRDSGVR